MPPDMQDLLPTDDGSVVETEDGIFIYFVKSGVTTVFNLRVEDPNGDPVTWTVHSEDGSALPSGIQIAPEGQLSITASKEDEVRAVYLYLTAVLLSMLNQTNIRDRSSIITWGGSANNLRRECDKKSDPPLVNMEKVNDPPTEIPSRIITPVNPCMYIVQPLVPWFMPGDRVSHSFSCVPELPYTMDTQWRIFFTMFYTNYTCKLDTMPFITVCKLKICGHLSDDNSTNISDINKIPFD